MFSFGQVPTYHSDVQFDLGVSPDKHAFTLTFGNLQVAVQPGKSSAPMATRLFYLALPLEDGGKGVEIAFAVSGAVATLEGATGTMVFSVNGQTIVADFPANSDQSYVQQLTFKAETASECRLGVFLLAGRDSNNSNAEAFLNVTSIDAGIQPSR
jgi:hypothetical protein